MREFLAERKLWLASAAASALVPCVSNTRKNVELIESFRTFRECPNVYNANILT